jgi:hypothetical protein
MGRGQLRATGQPLFISSSAILWWRRLVSLPQESLLSRYAVILLNTHLRYSVPYCVSVRQYCVLRDCNSRGDLSYPAIFLTLVLLCPMIRPGTLPFSF